MSERSEELAAAAAPGARAARRPLRQAGAAERRAPWRRALRGVERRRRRRALPLAARRIRRKAAPHSSPGWTGSRPAKTRCSSPSSTRPAARSPAARRLMRIDAGQWRHRDRQHLLGAADLAQAGGDRGAVPVHAIRLRRRSAIAATSGNATTATSRRSAPPLRFGFSFEGVFRQNMVVKGENRDTAWYSIIDKEWPALKRAYQEWLDPANFAADGKQKRRLEEIRARTRDRSAACSIATTHHDHAARSCRPWPWRAWPRPRPCAWRHRQDARADRRRLTGGFMVAEAIGGFLTGSLALVADAGHMLTDSISLALAWYAFHLAEPRGDGAAHLWLRPGQDAGRLHQRPGHLRHRAVDRLRGVAALPRADAGSRRADAGGGDRRPAGQHRRLLSCCMAATAAASTCAARSCMCSATCWARPARSSRRWSSWRPAGRRSIRSCRCWSRC